MVEPRRIVVLGGGFAGLHLVRRLERRLRPGEVTISLVDRQNYHLFTPLLYQVCTGELPPHAVAYPLRDLMDHTLRKIYPSIDFYADVAIHLIEGTDRVLPAMHPKLSAIAMRRLEQQRIRVLLNTLVSDIAPGVVHTKDGAQLRARTIVWSGGVKVNPLVASIDLPKSKDGRIVVDDRFRASARDDVMVLGDAAYFEHDGKGLPQLAQVAVLEAPAAARNLVALVRGEPTEPFVYHRKRDLVAPGRRQAGPGSD